MACCAVAAFIICNIVLFVQRLRARLAGAPATSPARNPAATWTPGSPRGTGTAASRRRSWRAPALIALGLGFAATAVATMTSHPERPAPLSIAQILDRADATLCGSIRQLSRTVEHDGAAPGEH